MAELRKYQEQLERMKRWYRRFKEIDEGRPHERESDYYQDVVYAFFINCYHLKDWIENDDTVGDHARSKVHGFINKNVELKLCSDICHSLKHLKRNTQGRSGMSPQFGSRKFAMDVQKNIIGVKYSITTETGETFDAFQLASTCLQLWEKFIEENIE
jgi:hypothetical protein